MKDSPFINFLAGVIGIGVIIFVVASLFEAFRRLWHVVKGLQDWVIIVAFVVSAGIMGLFYGKDNGAKKEKDLME